MSNWRSRGKIPPEYSLMVREALAAVEKEADPSVFGFKTAVEARA